MDVLLSNVSLHSLFSSTAHKAIKGLPHRFCMIANCLLFFGRYSRSNIFKFISILLISLRFRCSKRHSTQPLCMYDYIIASKTCQHVYVAQNNYIFHMQNTKLTHVNMYDIILIGNKATAVQESWRSLTPAQVVLAPTQRESPHRGNIIPFLHPNCKGENVS